MSVARAPGKVVVSGAYAVLEGAPAIVTAVDRYVTADSSRPAEIETPEVVAALGDRAPPWFDATPLRAEGRKLGLGSSAAILVASLAALALDDAPAPLSADDLRDAVLRPAILAHAAAQGGGSGIDVATSAYGGTIAAERRDDDLRVTPIRLPRDVHLEVWAAGQPASTPTLVAQVGELRDHQRATYDSLLSTLGRAARRAAEAATANRAADFLDALAAQARGLDALGIAADAPIVTPAVRELFETGRREGVVVMPSGAGGGDIAIFAAAHPPSTTLEGLAIERGLSRLRLRLEARGVHSP